MNWGRAKTLSNITRFRCDFVIVSRTHTGSSVTVSDYTDEPVYPPIQDLQWKAKRHRRKEDWHAKVTQLPTVEQKMMELNMPHYHGYNSFKLSSKTPRLNGLPFVQYATRTHLVNGFPNDYYAGIKDKATEIANEIQDQVQSLINVKFNSLENKCDAKSKKGADFFLGLHRILNATLSQRNQHVKESVCDLNPRIEAFWFLGGIEPDKRLKKTRKNFKPTEDWENDLVDVPVQGYSSPLLAVRGELGLPEVVSADDPLATSSEVPVANLDPRVYGFRKGLKHATVTPGFWPGESKEHYRLWLHTYDSIERNCAVMDEKYHNIFLLQKMILASFSQALAVATYLGFGPVTELTYPFVQQSVISDGQKWRFSLYQLNTCALHSDRAVENPLNNILWLSDEHQLFEAVDNTGVKGFNKEVLAQLISMYLKEGIERENPTPYLASYKHVANHPSLEEYREEFHYHLLQNLLSGRPRHIKMPEIYQWERIYKIAFNTRPMEPPRKFYENHFNQRLPIKRRLDDYSPIYIPKALRKSRRAKYKPRLNSEHLFKFDEGQYHE